jgi:hypothetical protein
LEGATKQLDESAAGMQGDVTTVSKPIQWIGIGTGTGTGKAIRVMLLCCHSVSFGLLILLG